MRWNSSSKTTCNGELEMLKPNLAQQSRCMCRLHYRLSSCPNCSLLNKNKQFRQSQRISPQVCLSQIMKPSITRDAPLPLGLCKEPLTHTIQLKVNPSLFMMGSIGHVLMP